MVWHIQKKLELFSKSGIIKCSNYNDHLVKLSVKQKQ